MRMNQKNKENQGFTRVPHWYFREFMPCANQTQMAVVGFVIDQTRGWGKRRDKTTLRHIADAIGQSRDAVSDNIQLLVDSGAVIIEDKNGLPLNTPVKRRIQGVKKHSMYFRIPDELVGISDKLRRANISKHAGNIGQSLPDNPTSQRRKYLHYKIKERNKESRQTPAKETGRSCPNCGKPADEMDRAYIRWKFKIDSDLCKECCKLTNKQP